MTETALRSSLSAAVLLAALSAIANAATPLSAQTAGGPDEARVAWMPESPRQGRLLSLDVQAAPGRSLRAVEGTIAGERLHLERRADGGFGGLAGLPVDAPGEVEARLSLRYDDDSSDELRILIPVESAPFDHEELTVAPRFGSPPSEEDRARRAADVAKARAVSEAAHETPRLWDGQVELPRDDRVTSGFGNGRVFNGQVSSRHMGLDLDGEPGDTVYAAARGVVELVDTFQLAGNIVYLNHGAGLVSGYFHLSEQLVSRGDTVVAGTPIGRVGATGRVTGPHLHWVVRYGHTSVDPRSLLEVLPASEPATGN
jgi:murein DD-endopeptidase MepM/ murein hydrolase activator NlpD